MGCCLWGRTESDTTEATQQHTILRASWVAQLVRIHLPMQDTQETQVQDDLLKKEMATHPSILAWKIPWTEEPDGI